SSLMNSADRPVTASMRHLHERIDKVSRGYNPRCMSNLTSGEASVGRKQRILLRIERFSRQRCKLVFGGSLILFAPSVWIGSRIKIESDVLNLIPRGNRQVDTFREALHEFGSIDYLILLLDAAEDEGPDEIEDFADLLAEK